ncbi:MAG TPA: hypothetical protein DCS07_08665 [Bdellovibrionales bacterium]|nr:MAG: hypothetical protein A2X97_02275 [Bdellovibrionales bacterium GWA1_52_35]HAR42682.1 hypothetical protein [Bdellovibrionales bacterium]HCM39232.1 hypothetical protein [Bdellovibrionales bacterium]
MSAHVIAVTNQKGGVGKTTTAMNLSVALSKQGHKVLSVDMDPHGNLTQGLGLSLGMLTVSIRDLIVERSVTSASAIHKTASGVDLIGANPNLAGIARWLLNQTNTELRLKQRVQELRAGYDFIVIDTCPGLGVLLNSALNAADSLIIPVDTGFYGYMGVQELFHEIEEIRLGTNPELRVLGFVLTMTDRTLISKETLEALKNRFGSLVFETVIRRCVSLRESPAVGLSIFDYSPKSIGADDYAGLADEALARLAQTNVARIQTPIAEVSHG